MEHTVRFRCRARSRVEWRSVRVADGTPLLAAARALGLPLASACGARSLCGRCGLEVLGGGGSLSAEGPEEASAKARNRIPQASRLACRTLVHGDVDATARYW